MPRSQGGANPEREKEVLRLNGEGKTDKEIGVKLGITKGTVGYYLYKNDIYKNKKNRKNGGNNKTNGITHVASKKDSDDATTLPPEIEIQQAYATGRIEELLRGYAQSSGIPFALFAFGVAANLHATARGEWLRMQNRMLPLWGTTAEGSAAAPKVALAKLSRSTGAHKAAA